MNETSVLITGGFGFIGSAIARHLVLQEIVDKVVLVDSFGTYISPLKSSGPDYRKERIKGIEDRIVIERALTNHGLVMARLLRRHKPVYIFHLAALPLAKIDNLNTEEALEGTVRSTATILEACADLQSESDYRLERFVYASSSMVYGNFATDVVDETSQTRPVEIYGTMKLAGEEVTRGLSRFYGIPHAIVRPSAVYGPGDMNRRVSQIFFEKAKRGEKISVHGEDERLDFTFVEDTAKGFCLAASEPGGEGETFNITAGRAVRLLDFVVELKKHFPNIDYAVQERDAFRPKRGTLSIDKARALLGYEPDFDIERGIKRMIDFDSGKCDIAGRSV